MQFTRRALAAIGLCLAAATASASTANPVSNVDYKTLDKALPAEVGNKVEVVEFFSYACPHCNAFDPDLAAWVKAKGDAVAFKRVPVPMHEGDLLPKLYYAIDAMGISEQLHSKVFHAIHVEHKQFDGVNQIADFVASQGIDRAKFLAAFNSFGVQAKLQRGDQLADLYKISGVPLLAIDGRFEASPEITSATLGNVPHADLVAATLKVSDWLVAKAAKEHKPPAAAAKK